MNSCTPYNNDRENLCENSHLNGIFNVGHIFLLNYDIQDMTELLPPSKIDASDWISGWFVFSISFGESGPVEVIQIV